MLVPIALIEQDGAHMPLATETYGAYLLAEHIKARLAEMGVEAVIAPSFYLGMYPTLSELFLEHGIPEHLRSDNGPEFVAKAVRERLADLGVTTLFIEPGSSWENGYVQCFNRKLRDELLNGEIFYTLREAQILIENWRREYDHVRPHTSLEGRPPSPETIAWPGFSFRDYAPPTLTREPVRALS